VRPAEALSGFAASVFAASAFAGAAFQAQPEHPAAPVMVDERGQNTVADPTLVVVPYLEQRDLVDFEIPSA
jgi:hypothetical protein